MPDPTALTGLQIIVNGFDVTAFVPKGTLTINLENAQHIDTASFKVQKGSQFSIDRWQTVYIKDLVSDVTYFWGYITDFTQEKMGVDIDYDLNCSSSKVRLDKSFIDGSFTDNDADMIDDILSGSTPDLSDLFGTSGVTGIFTDPFTLDFSNGSALSALNDLADFVGATWNVESGNTRTNIFYNPNLQSDASYLNDDPTGAPGGWSGGTGSWGAGFGETGGGYRIPSQNISAVDYVYLGIGNDTAGDTSILPVQWKDEPIWLCIQLRAAINAGANVQPSWELHTYEDDGTLYATDSQLNIGTVSTSWTDVSRCWDMSDKTIFPQSGYAEFTLRTNRASGAYTLAVDKFVVEQVYNAGTTLGADLVTNGDFSADSDWTKGGGWTISGGTANHASGVSGNLTQEFILEELKRTQVQFTISNYVSGSLQLEGSDTVFTADGTYTETFEAQSQHLVFIASSGLSASLDDVSAKAVEGVAPVGWPVAYYDGDSANSGWFGTDHDSQSWTDGGGEIQWNEEPPSASFDIDIDNMDEIIQNLELDTSGSDAITSVIVTGGAEFVAFNFEYPSNGRQTHFDLEEIIYPQAGETTIQVSHNDGDDTTPVWDDETVGDRDVDDFSGSATVLYDKEDHWLEFETAPPDLERGFRVIGTIKRRIQATVTDTDEEAAIGISLVDSLFDESIKSESEAHSKGAAELANRSATKNLSFETYEPGLFPGTEIDVTDSSLGLSAEAFVIQRVSMQFLGGGYTINKVEAGPYIPHTEDLIWQGDQQYNKNAMLVTDTITSPVTLDTLLDANDSELVDANNSELVQSTATS